MRLAREPQRSPHPTQAAKIAKAGRRSKDLRESVLLARDVSRRFLSIGKRRRASSVDRPYEGEYLQDDSARKGLLDAKKRAKDSSRIVFSDEQTVAQLVQGGEKGEAPRGNQRAS